MPDKPDYLFDFAVRHSWHRISRMYNQKAAEHEMTMSIGFILMNVDKAGTPSTALGPKMGMEPTSLSRTLKTMEERGLIYRQEVDHDKRKVLIFLTLEGIEKRKMVKNFVLGFNDRILAKIPKSKMKIFFEVIEKVDLMIEEDFKNS
ncbi:MAG: MarR family winged helix-turn-helix transcriptional regulator [Crocinitomicaceae bacterium]|nr:MarR family winged helix-turn-helix transcriptional regulator [Crocinitomicaceae bacterium]MCF8433725.1 MarR family winged helix-turn-helix transcriptional regulator [Crocinitomicaceae bacterium]